jgi:hypothetical protein
MLGMIYAMIYMPSQKVSCKIDWLLFSVNAGEDRAACN